MNILFITQFYPPEIGAASNRIGYFAKFLAERGHKVTVLTTTPNYPEGKAYPGFENHFTKREDGGVTVIRTRIFLSIKKNFAGRLAHYLSFLVKALVARGKIEKPDIIVATSPPLFVGIIGVLFKKLWRVPLVTDIRDLWPQSVASVGIVRNRGLLKQAEKLAVWIYKNSDWISATSPGIQKHLPSFAQNKIAIHPNGAELDLFDGKTDPEKLRREYLLGEKFIVLYTGNLGLAQAPEVFIEAAEYMLRQAQHDRTAQHDNVTLSLSKGDVVFLIVGSGVLLPNLEKQAREKNLTNIIFAGNQPRNRMPDFIAAANVCIIPYKAEETFRHTLPSKMFDYMAGAKPIIINLQGEASELLDKAGCGLLAKEENALDLAEKIRELENNPERAQTMGKSGRLFVEKNYRRETVSENLEKLLKKIKV